ncbi:MAG: hypothetical protein J4F42_06240 [Desulfurellaceae bacterium]|nr:hypothetical protein [Desulfurellaceae bacterium]
MIVKLRRRNARYPDLSSHQQYMVIGVEADAFRILNDEGRPYLYPARLFEVLDPREPADWATEFGEDGERYAYPPPLNSNGFFEDFFESDKEAVATFWRVVNQRLAAA